MQPSPLLTICIPSYNRGERVQGLVEFLLANVLAHREGDAVELVVSNNASSDATTELLSPYVERGLRLVQRDAFLPTVEEHLFACVPDCRGKFIWFLGDDEVVSGQAVIEYLRLLRDTDCGLVISNAGIIDNDGSLLTERMLPMNAYILRMPGRELPKAAGFCFALAGISSLIVRRDLLDPEQGRRLFKVENIYSHVAWLLKAVADEQTALINRPLVYYRVADEGHQFRRLREAAIAGGRGDFHCWGFGLARLLSALVDAGALTPATIARAYEARRDGSRFRLLDELVYQMFRQAALGAESAETRNQVSRTAFREARAFVLSADLSMYDLLEPIARLVELTHSPLSKRQRRRAVRRERKAYRFLFAKHQMNNPMLALFAGSYLEYQLFEGPFGCVAVRADEALDPAEVMAALDPVESAPDVLVASDLASLREQVEQVARITLSERCERDKAQAVVDLAHVATLWSAPLLAIHFLVLKIARKVVKVAVGARKLRNRPRHRARIRLRKMARGWLEDL